MDDTLKKRIEETLSSHDVVVFIKGTKNFPQCGFSARMMELMKIEGVSFKDVNILADPELRQGLKEYSNWPTFPQLYVRGKLIGGSDIAIAMHERGELATVLKPNATAAT